MLLLHSDRGRWGSLSRVTLTFSLRSTTSRRAPTFDVRISM
jgi:hypothetical protein